jgi:hypothetical protein
MHNTGPIDGAERDKWNADANRRAKHWLIWTLLLLVVAYFLPLRWAVILALFYAGLADPDLNLRDLPFAFPLPFLFRPPRRNTIYATSVILKDESSGNTRGRFHILDNGEPALSLYSETGDEAAVFTPGSERSKGETVRQLENETRGLDQRVVGVETGYRELREISENVHELQSRVEQLAEADERESKERNQKISSHSFELLDEEGNARARLQTSSGGQPSLSLYDKAGECRAWFALNENDYPELFLTNLLNGGPADGRNHGRIFLGFPDDGYPQLEMYDSDALDGDPAASLSVHKIEGGREAGLFVQVWSDDGGHNAQYFGARVKNRISGDRDTS